jgi:hypothetical protein
MKINGAYKFRTKATVNRFVSTYVKVEFYSGGDRITPDEYAEILTNGYVNEFKFLTGYYYVYWAEGANSGNLIYESPNLSCNVVVTVIAADEKGNIIFSRSFDDLYQYTVFADGGFEELESNSIYAAPLFAGTIPFVSAFPDIDQDNKLSIHGVILGGGYNGLIERLYTNGERLLTQKRTPDLKNHQFHYPSYIFKDEEPLTDICQKAFYSGAPVFWQGTPKNLFFAGDGSWLSEDNRNSYTPDYSIRLLAVKYPDIQYSVFYPDYLLDIDRIVSYSTEDVVSDYSLLKDSKTGNLFRKKTTAINGGISVEYFLDDNLIFNEFIESVDSDRQQYNFFTSIFSLFLYDGNYYSCFFKYDFNKDAIVASLMKNISPERYWNETHDWDNMADSAVFRSPVDNTIFGILTEGKIPQMYESENIKMLPDFVEALLETYPLTPPIILPRPELLTPSDSFPNGTWSNQREFDDRDVYWTDFVTTGVQCYSTREKSLWIYVDSVFIPDEIEWKDEDLNP